MGYDNRFTGAITIAPPLTRSQINDPRIARRTDVKLRIVEQRTESDDGEAFTVRPVADAIVPLDMEYSGHSLEDDIQLIIDTFSEHEFAGFIEARWDPGFGELPSRFIVKDQRVVRIDAQYRWPGVWDDDPDTPPRPAPKRMHADDLAAILTDMAARIPAGDSFGGSIEYEIADGAAHEFDVLGAYRIGNTMGQGGTRIIEGQRD